MTNQEIANRLIELMRQGNYSQAQNELFSEQAVSIEPEGSPNPLVQGLDSIKKKSEQWEQMVDSVQSTEVSDPLVAENFISCAIYMKVTFKGQPGPVDMDEVCLYEVKDGKIVKEQFFYTPMPVNA